MSRGLRTADTRFDRRAHEARQRLKSALGERSPKTVNNVLTVLSVVLRTAGEWGVIERVPCSIKLLPTPKSAASFYDFDEYERLVDAAWTDSLACLVVLLGGEAGLRCGEIMAVGWTDVDLHKRQLCVARSEWKGHVTVPKGGRLRYVPLTKRLTEALRDARHVREPRVLCDAQGQRLTQKVIQVMMRRAARRANVRPGVHIPCGTRSVRISRRGEPQRDRFRTCRTQGSEDDAAVHAPQSGGAGCRDSIARF